MSDPHDLARFVDAQAGVHDTALAELTAGRKRSHWMWFVFPQIAGLGLSETSRRYAVRSLAEARAYLTHPVLGPRLIACVAAVLAHRDRTAEAIFGPVDAAKLRSSLTLFEAAADDAAPFRRALEAFFRGERDGRTLDLIA